MINPISLYFRKRVCVFVLGSVVFCLSTLLLDAQNQSGDLWSLAPLGAKIRGFEIPLRNNDGYKTGLISGSEAIILDRFQVKVEGLILDSFAGEVQPIHLRISQGIYNRYSETLISDGFFVLRQGVMEISGKGLIWNIREQKGSVFNDVRVVIQPEAMEDSKVIE